MDSDKILVGKVYHKRLKPINHSLSYNVFSLLLDCKNIESETRKLRMLSYNRFNLFSIYDKDYGDGTTIISFLQKIQKKASTKNPVEYFQIITYPRFLGYVFNPITIYIGYNKNRDLELVIYEVNNTFGQRVVYVIPVEDKSDNKLYQSCDKKLFISPFNGKEGKYSFLLSINKDKFCVGVNLRVNGDPVLKAYFSSDINELSDKNLIKSLKKNILLTYKVIFAIHYEAIKLFLKGLRFKEKPKAPKLQIWYN